MRKSVAGKVPRALGASVLGSRAHLTHFSQRLTSGVEISTVGYLSTVTGQVTNSTGISNPIRNSRSRSGKVNSLIPGAPGRVFYGCVHRHILPGQDRVTHLMGDPLQSKSKALRLI